MPIVEQVINGVPGIAFYETRPEAPEYRSQAILVGVAKSLRRAVRRMQAGDLAEAVRWLTHADHCRGIVSGQWYRPSSRRVDRVALKVSSAICDEVQRHCPRRGQS